MKKHSLLPIVFAVLLLGGCQTDTAQGNVPAGESSAAEIADFDAIDRDNNAHGSDLRQQDADLDNRQAELYRNIREQVAYTGKRELGAYFYTLSDTDATGREIEALLECVGLPPKTITTPQDWDNEYILYRVLAFVERTETCDAPIVQPLASAVGSDVLVLKEHVEAAALEIFGAEVTHRSISVVGTAAPVAAYGWIWHEIEGVYTPPMAWIDLGPQPVVLQYTEEKDGYRVEAVYSDNGLDWFDEGLGEDALEQAIAAEKAKLSALPRYEIYIAKKEDGALAFKSCVALSGTSAEKPQAWQKAYAAFLREYPFIDDNAIPALGEDDRLFQFSLRDLDNSGVPELLVIQSDTDALDASFVAYTFDGTVHAIGEFKNKKGSFISGLRTSDNPLFPGLFESWNGGGEEHYGYLSLKDGRLAYEYLWRNDRTREPPHQTMLSDNQQLIEESISLYPLEDATDNLLELHWINDDNIKKVLGSF